MYTILILLICSLVSSNFAAQVKIKIVDEIIAQVYSPEGNEIILYSDLIAGIDGQSKTMREVVLERLTVLDARKYKIQVTEEELDRFLAQLLKQNSWTRNDFIMFLDQHGYTYEEGRELLRNKQMMNQVLDYRVRSDRRMIVKREEAFEHYKAHPENEEATFTLAIAYAPFSTYSAEQLDTMVADNAIPETLVWDEPFTLKTSELADDRQFIMERPVDSIVLVDKLEDGYELTKLIEKTPAKEIPFDDVYGPIVSKIRQGRFAQVLQDYQDELLKNAQDNGQLKFYRKEFTLD
jgi:hypothetical protein